MGKYKNVIQNINLKILAPSWNDKFELPDGSFSVSHFRDCFKLYQKKT